LAALFVDADAAADHYLEAVLGTEAKEQGLAPEEDDRELRLGVFEGEVEMARGRRAEVGDFALDPDVDVLAFNEFTDPADQFADRPDAAGRRRLLKGEVELGR